MQKSSEILKGNDGRLPGSAERERMYVRLTFQNTLWGFGILSAIIAGYYAWDTRVSGNVAQTNLNSSAISAINSRHDVEASDNEKQRVEEARHLAQIDQSLIDINSANLRLENNIQVILERLPPRMIPPQR